MSVTYMTRQQRAVLSCMEGFHGGVSAAEVARLLHAKGEAAVVTHLVGEAPDVAQAHRGADGRHQESKCTLETFSFFHKSSLLSKSKQVFRFMKLFDK